MPPSARARRRDPFAAFCGHADVRRHGASTGPLAGLTFAVKDAFEIAGVAACFGNPTWLQTHAPAERTADAVSCLEQAGAALQGLTMMDELALSLTGENHHYGTPVNPRCPDRVPGGSSSGSAAAVAGGLVDFALGTDTGGSVRVPASHTGILGMRPTWGSVSARGVLPLAPRFDTVGWFARDASTLARVGSALLAQGVEDFANARSVANGSAGPSFLLAPLGVEALLDPAAVQGFRDACSALAEGMGVRLVREPLGDDSRDPSEWAAIYLALQNAELAAIHREFVERERPAFGSLIAGRFARAFRVTRDEAEAAEMRRAGLVAALEHQTRRGAWLVLPSAPGAAPRLGTNDAVLDAFTWRGLSLAAPASLTGLPQISLPLATADRCPLGVSLVGPAGADRALLRAAETALAKAAFSPFEPLRTPTPR